MIGCKDHDLHGKMVIYGDQRMGVDGKNPKGALIPLKKLD
jgi:hypothetical protein